MKTFRSSSFNRYWAPQIVFQFLNSTSLIYETNQINTGTAKSARPILRAATYSFTFECI